MLVVCLYLFLWQKRRSVWCWFCDSFSVSLVKGSNLCNRWSLVMDNQFLPHSLLTDYLSTLGLIHVSKMVRKSKMHIYIDCEFWIWSVSYICHSPLHRRHNGHDGVSITSITIVYSTVYSGAYQSKHQSSASLAFVRGIHRWAVNSPQKWPVVRKMFHLRTPILRSRYIFRILQSNITFAYKWEIAIDVAVISLWGNAAIWCLYWHIWNNWFKLGNAVFDSKCTFRYWMLLFCYYRNRFSSSRWGLVHVAGVGISVWRSSANERRRYVVMSALIGWAHTHNDHCGVS